MKNGFSMTTCYLGEAEWSRTTLSNARQCNQWKDRLAARPRTCPFGFHLLIRTCFTALLFPGVGPAAGPSTANQTMISSSSTLDNAPLAVSPPMPSVTPNQKITLVSTQPATFTLSGPGTCTGCGVPETLSIVYTAPSSVNPQANMAGCQVAPNDSIFVTPVNSLPVNANSSTWVSGSSLLPFSFQPSEGISLADGSTPVRVLKSYYGQYTTTVPWPKYNNMRRENGNYLGSTGFATPDHHVMTVNTSDCSISESYGDKLNGLTFLCSDGETTGCNVSSAISYPGTNYNVPAAGGTDAAGLPLAPLLVHLAELKAGVIKHALRFTTALGYVQGNTNAGEPLLWPASRSNGCSVCFSAPVIGARARLKLSFDTSMFSLMAKVILVAMQTFGIMLADVGTSNAITTAADLRTDSEAVAAITEIYNAGITPVDMEFVDESSLQAAVGSYRVCPLNTTCLGAENTYVSPLDQVTVIATNGSASINVPIALQSVGIGTSLEPDVLVMAGAYTWKVATWVTGSSDQNVMWTLTSGVGSITSDGVYSPPPNTVAGASAVIHAVAEANPSATLDLYLKIAPAGTIRLDTGAAADSVDGNGNAWLALQPEGWVAQFNDIWPQWTTTSPFRIQYETGAYTYGSDMTYPNVVLPNGNYQVSWLLGLNSQCGTTPCSSYVTEPLDIFTYAPIHLESQNQIGYFSYDWLAPIGYISAAPSPIVSIPAKVTNNILYASIRSVSNDIPPYYAPGPNHVKAVVLNGVTIAPSSATPHWEIDNRRQTTISPGQTLLPFRVVDWFTGVNDAVWTVVGKGASIVTTTSDDGALVGTLSLAADTVGAGQPITVTASDGINSASVTVYAAGPVGRRSN